MNVVQYFTIVFVSSLMLHVTGQYRAEYQIDDCTGWVSISITPNNTTFSWDNFVCAKKAQITHLSISTVPPLFGQTETPEDVCKNLGSSIFNHTITTGSGSIGSMESMASTNAVGMPPNTVFHRGLILTNSDESVRLCATILPDVDFDLSTSTIETFQAKIKGSIVGDVTIRTSKTISKSFVYVDLFEKSPASALRMLSISTSSALKEENCPEPSDSEEQLLEFYPSIDDTSPKSLKGAVTGRTDFATQLPSIVIKDGSQIIACGQLIQIDRKVATAQVASNGLVSELKLTQSSPFDPTFVELNLSDTKILPTSYTIHEFPVRQRVDPTADRCALIGDILNPYDSSASSGGKDELKMGDLTGKNRVLSNGDLGGVQILGPDFHLPLFGRHSVIGRSFQTVSAGGKRSCAVIHLNGVEMITAVAHFRTNGVYGDIIMRQPKNQWKAETSFFSDLAYYKGTSTTNHNYHVHSDKVKDNNCGSAAGHYNPLQVDVESQYGRWCTPSTPQRCELGDLSKKHSALNIAASLATTESKMFFTDSFLPLSGPYGIIGRSIVIHDPEAMKPRFVCADIFPLHPVKLVANASSTRLTLTQDSEFDDTKVSYTGDPKINGSGFTIHEKSAGGCNNESMKCLTSNIGGVYDPFNVTDDSAMAGGTQDEYKVGSLVKKSSVIKGNDNNLPLFTPLSVSGRTVVRDDGACGELKPFVDSSNAVSVEAAATYMYDDFNGFIKMRQILYHDGSTSATSVEVKLQTSDGNVFSPIRRAARSSETCVIECVKSENHSYHVHLNPAAKPSTCEKVEGHFDPYQVKNDNYGVICTTINQLACEVGDLSQKHGQVSINGEWQFYNDDNLPLGGVNSVIGRSIKIHGNPNMRLHHCATILPPADKSYTICFPKATTYTHETFTAAMSKQLEINVNQIITVHNKNVPNDGGDDCHCVIVYIPGDVKSSSIDSLLKSNLNAYDAERKCTSTKGQSGMNSSSTTSAASMMVFSLLLFSLFLL